MSTAEAAISIIVEATRRRASLGKSYSSRADFDSSLRASPDSAQPFDQRDCSDCRCQTCIQSARCFNHHYIDAVSCFDIVFWQARQIVC